MTEFEDTYTNVFLEEKKVEKTDIKPVIKLDIKVKDVKVKDVKVKDDTVHAMLLSW